MLDAEDHIGHAWVVVGDILWPLDPSSTLEGVEYGLLAKAYDLYQLTREIEGVLGMGDSTWAEIGTCLKRCLELQES